MNPDEDWFLSGTRILGPYIELQAVFTLWLRDLAGEICDDGGHHVSGIWEFNCLGQRLRADPAIHETQLVVCFPSKKQQRLHREREQVST